MGRLAVVLKVGYVYGNQDVERGQVLGLKGLLNDKKLLDGGYMRKLESEDEKEVVGCGMCGLRFFSEAYLDGHKQRAYGTARHAPIVVGGPQIKGEDFYPFGDDAKPAPTPSRPRGGKTTIDLMDPATGSIARARDVAG